MRGNWVGPEERGRRRLSHDTSTAGGGPRQIESPRPWPGARRHNQHRGRRQAQRGTSSIYRKLDLVEGGRCGGAAKISRNTAKGGTGLCLCFFLVLASSLFDMSPLLLSHDFHPRKPVVTDHDRAKGQREQIGETHAQNMSYLACKPLRSSLREPTLRWVLKGVRLHGRNCGQRGTKRQGDRRNTPRPPLLKSQGKEGCGGGQEEGKLVTGDEIRNIKKSKNDSRVSPCGASASA